MNMVQRKLKTENLRFRLLVFTFTAILFVTVISTTIGNYFYTNSIEEHSYANTAEIQNQVGKSVDLKLEEVENTLRLLGNTQCVQDYMMVDVDNEQGERVRLETEVRNLLLEYSKIYGDYLNIVIVSGQGHYLSNDSYRIQKTGLHEEDWYQEALKANGKPVVISTSIGRNLKVWRNYSSDSYVSVAQSVGEKQSGEMTGVILIDLNKADIENLVDDITLGQTGFVYIMDSHGKVLYSPENKIVYRINPSWFQGKQSGSIKCSILEGKYHVIFNKSEYTNLTTVGVYDMGKTIEGVSKVKYTSFMVALISCVLALLWSIVFSKTFTTPISKLSKLMQEAQTGNLEVRFDNYYKGEIRQLGDAFNSMVDKINNLIELVYQEQKDKRESEMKILREQIKPHFLYNTLDTIQWMAKKYNAQDIVEIVLSLSNFFRISLSKGKEYIMLQEEITMVKSYLDVQKFRYEDLFEYEASCEEELLHCKVPKLILQPLIENALYHGIKESDRLEGMIWITAGKQDEEHMHITVTDDGAGMDEDACDRLNSLIHMNERPVDTEAFGVLNVHDRIRLSYGEKYGLTYLPGEGGGTVVVILLPIIKE